MDSMSNSNPISNREKKSYFWICTIFMIYILSFSLVLPAIPGLILQLVHGDNVLSSYYYGISTFMRYIIEFITAPVLGSVADSHGRRPVFFTSLCICALEFFLLALFPSVPMIFIARGLSGLGDVGASTTYTVITDIATYNNDVVAQKYGLMGAMFGLAFIIGPFAGGLLSSVSFTYVY